MSRVSGGCQRKRRPGVDSLWKARNVILGNRRSTNPALTQDMDDVAVTDAPIRGASSCLRARGAVFHGAVGPNPDEDRRETALPDSPEHGTCPGRARACLRRLRPGGVPRCQRGTEHSPAPDRAGRAGRRAFGSSRRVHGHSRTTCRRVAGAGRGTVYGGLMVDHANDSHISVFDNTVSTRSREWKSFPIPS